MAGSIGTASNRYQTFWKSRFLLPHLPRRTTFRRRCRKRDDARRGGLLRGPTEENGHDDDGLSTPGVESRRQPGFQFKVGRACRDFNVQNAYAKLFAPLMVVVVVVMAVAPSVSSSSSQTPLTPWHSDRRTTTSVSTFRPGGKKSASLMHRQVERVRKSNVGARWTRCSRDTNAPVEHFEVAATKGQITFLKPVHARRP